jgi:hypothetical protein
LALLAAMAMTAAWAHHAMLRPAFLAAWVSLMSLC